jgi:hypothetical protein
MLHEASWIKKGFESILRERAEVGRSIDSDERKVMLCNSLI